MAYQPKSYRKFLATSVATALVATAVAPSAMADAHSFPDVEEGIWFEQYVEFGVERGLFQGYPDGTFQPYADMTRAEAITSVLRGIDADIPEQVEETSFPDVATNNWFAGAVEEAYERGIVQGMPSGNFEPNAEITRAELAAMIYNAFNLSAYVEDYEHSFTDLVDGAWYEAPIAALYQLEIVEGDGDGTFRPNDDIQRNEVAAMLYRTITFLEDQGEEPVLEVDTVTVVDAETIEVTLSDDTTHTVTLDTALEANVETEVTFEIDGVEYTATVTWEVDSVAVAEAAIAELPELEDVTLADRAAIAEARALVDAALEEDEDAEIEGLEDLEALEAAITDLLESVAFDSAAFVTTSSFQVTLEEGVTGLTAEDFEVMLELDDEDEVEVDFEVSSDEDGEVYTFTHADLAGEEGTVTVSFGEDVSTELTFNFTETALQAAITAVNSADNDEDLLAALQAPVLNLTDVNPEFISQYAAEIDDSVTNTVARIQAAIDRVNVEFSAEIEELIADLNAAVGISGEEGIRAILNELNVDNYIEINGFELAYFEAIQDQAPQTLTEVQDLIDEANLAVVTAAVEAAVSAPNAETTDFTEVHDWVNAYEANGADEDLIDELRDQLELAEAIADVNNTAADFDEADPTTVTAFDDALEDLSDLTDDFDYDVVVDANLGEYAEAIDEADPVITTAAGFQSLVEEVNLEVAAERLADLTDEDDIFDNDGNVDSVAFLAALEDLENVSSLNFVNVAYEAHYASALQAQVDADEDFEFTTVGQVQDFVNNVNAVAELFHVPATEEDENTALESFAVSVDNDAYIDLFAANRAEIYPFFLLVLDDVDLDLVTIEDLNVALTEAVELYTETLDSVNTATSTSQTRAALQSLVNLAAEADLLEELGLDDIVDGNDVVTLAAATNVFEFITEERATENGMNNYATFDQIITVAVEGDLDD